MKFADDIIQLKSTYFQQMDQWFDVQLDQKILDGLQGRNQVYCACCSSHKLVLPGSAKQTTGAERAYCSNIYTVNKGQCQQDLLTDSECSAGIEADYVISLGSKNVCAYMSRCRGQFVHIDEHQGIWFRMNSCCD